jgi:thiamine pyrophosphate-dependent acetolactate synthase large subunit-like protein
VIWQTGAITMGSGQTALPWEVVVDIQVRSNGATGTVFAMGRFSFNLTSTTATTLVMGSAGTATPAAVTVDLTVDQALCITGDWGTNSASNTTTLHQAFVEALN